MAPDLEQDPRAADMWPTLPVEADRLELLDQRTWHDVVGHSAFFNGSSFSVCIVEIADEPLPHGGVFLILRRAGSDEWGMMSSSVGPIRTLPDGRQRSPGANTMLYDFCLCVGGLQPFSTAHTLEVEMPDGSVTQDSYSGGAAVVFVPFLAGPSEGDQAVVRIRDAEGTIIAEDPRPLGSARPQSG